MKLFLFILSTLLTFNICLADTVATRITDPELSKKCKKAIAFQYGILWKPISEDSGYPKVGKPAIVIGKYKPEITKTQLRIYSANGKKLGTMGLYEYAGVYGARYYSGLGTGETAEELKAKALLVANSPKIYVEAVGKTCYGPINPIKRAGSPL